MKMGAYIFITKHSECQLEQQNKANRSWNLAVSKFGALAYLSSKELAEE